MKERENWSRSVEAGPYLIILYYCYTQVQDPDQFREEHHLLCVDLGLRGRIIVAKEGINGTISGLIHNCQEYMRLLRSDPRFETIEFKIEQYSANVFQKLNIRRKNEIVNAGLQDIKPPDRPQNYLEPLEFKQIKDREDIVILDVRSNYEHRLGRFKNAITLDLKNFRDFPEKVKRLEHLKNKKVITYCTGGIKCEKASAYLMEQSFIDVYQLHGGIIKYGLEARGEDFEGKCYVFDNRLAVDINNVNPTVLSTCYICGGDSDRMVNCSNPQCNRHVVMCEKCGWDMEGSCCQKCKDHPLKRHYDGKGHYPRAMNGYDPRQGLFRRTRNSAQT